MSMALQILLELEASGVKPASRDNSQLRPQDGGHLKNVQIDNETNVCNRMLFKMQGTRLL